MEQILLSFGFSEEENRRLQNIGSAAGLSVQAIPPEKYGLPVGAHVGLLPEIALDAGGPLSAQMLLFAFVDDSKIQAVLTGLRGGQVGVKSYKAVLTPNNMFWTAKQLLRELENERAELQDEPK